MCPPLEPLVVVEHGAVRGPALYLGLEPRHADGGALLEYGAAERRGHGERQAAQRHLMIYYKLLYVEYFC